MEIYEFRQITQASGETLNEFYRRLKEKASTCEFTNEEAEIRTQIIHKTSDARLRRKALRDEPDLKALLQYGLTLEQSDRHSKLLEEDKNTASRQTNFLKGRSSQERQREHKSQGKNTRYNAPAKPSTQKCRNCGGSYPHIGGKSSCPATGKTCFECGKIGHFGKHCLSKQRQQTRPSNHHAPQQRTRRDIRGLSEHPQSDTDEEFIYTIMVSTKAPETIVKIAELPVPIIIDTGSSVNILNYEHFKKINQQNPCIQLQPTRTKVFAYGAKQPLHLLGQFTAEIQCHSKRTTSTFLVTKDNNTCLLSYNTSIALGLLNININSISADHPDPRIAQVLQNHHKVFQGMGNLKNCKVTLEVDPTVSPVAQHSRRLPHSMRKKVNEKLHEMEEQGIIEKVKGVTPWLSPLIPIPKKGGDLRLVLDMRVPNQALKRRRVQFPTVDDILQKMEGATIFTEVDLSQGYLQISLAEESRPMTAFQTPDDGPYQFKRLIMGASPSGEYFHEIIHNLIKHIPNCQNISDNIWLWSKDITEHVKQLDELLQTMESSGLTLKFPKCSFAVSEINVFGHIVSSQGIRPDKKKVESVINAPAPKTTAEVRSFLGLVNYCSRYIKDYSTTTYPLRQLLKEKAKFHWGEEQQSSFLKLKHAITSAPILAHYSITAPTRVVVDASPWAVGAVLLQQQSDSTYRPVAFGSRSITETEMKYSQIEKEALAIVFGCEHFHLYLYGKSFEMETDHRPLEYIFKPKSAGKPAPARVERWLLRLQEYDFIVKYRPGPQNLADALSRLPNKTPRSNMESCADRHVHYLAEQLTPVAMNTAEIQEHSKADPELIQVRQCIQNNQPHKLPLQYQPLAQEMSIVDNIILRDNRIILPTKLRSQAIKLAHEDHAGMTKTKQRIRSKLWWPIMDKDIEQHIRTCHPCQIVGKPDRPEPVQPTKLPDEPWNELAIDVCGPFPTGEYVVSLTDYYSRWPEATILRTVSSAKILEWLDNVFATHGYPKQIESDNASYFTSQEFKQTLTSWGIQLHFVTPYWPQANGQVERFNQVILKHVLTSNTIGRDWRKSLPVMLRNYRTTPHQSTGETPAMMLMNRELRTKLPSFNTSKSFDDTRAQQTDAKAKKQAKEYADRKRRAQEKEFKIGDKVLLRQPHTNKYSTQFSSDPYTIIKINGSQLELRDKHGQKYKRNSAHAKKYHEVAEGRDEEEDMEHPVNEQVPQQVPQPEEETTPQPEQVTQPHQYPQQPLPLHSPPRKRSARKTKPPERFGY